MKCLLLSERMSIALHIEIIASRNLWLILCLFAAFISSICAYLLKVSDLALPYKIIAGISGLLLIGFLLSAFYLRRRTVLMDFSDSGRILLRWCDQKDALHSEVVQFHQRSTLSSGFMLLHLTSEQNEIFIIPVLSDSVSEEQFRRLSVALRSIRSHTA